MLVEGDGNRPIVLDLKDVSVVDRAGVFLLARSESHGATLLNCPSYVQEWIHREREFARSQGGAGGMSSGEHSMPSGVAFGTREEICESLAFHTPAPDFATSPETRRLWRP